MLKLIREGKMKHTFRFITYFWFYLIDLLHFKISSQNSLKKKKDSKSLEQNNVESPLSFL